MTFQIFFALLISLTKPVCSCDGVPTIKEAFESSSFVFSGTVLSVEYMPGNGSIKLNADTTELIFSHDFSFEYKKVLFKADDFYKGIFYPDTLIIHTPVGDAACGYNFKAGSRYIVYAWSSGRKYVDVLRPNKLVVYTGLCSRTQLWKQTEHVGLLKELKE